MMKQGIIGNLNGNNPRDSEMGFLQRTGECQMSADDIDTDPGSTLDDLAESSQKLNPDQACAVKVDFGAVTHAGKVREKNEDQYLVVRLSRSLELLMTSMPASRPPDKLAEYGYGMVVADGMGGAAAGEVASRMAANLLIKLVMDAASIRRIDEVEAEALKDRMEGYYNAIHSELVTQGAINPAIEGMGTTLTITYSFGTDLFIAHAGDSRAYMFREGQLRQLTRDHTVAQRLADQGEIPQEAVSKHRMRHILTNVLGGHDGPIITELQQLQLLEGDRLMLCSDGLTDMVKDADIVNVLRDIKSSQEACNALLNLALDAGGKDNITIAMARYAFPEKQ
jgi:protein phosphatase